MAAVLVVAVVTAAVAMMLTRSLAAKIPKHLLISWNQISAVETFAMLMAVAGALLLGVIVKKDPETLEIAILDFVVLRMNSLEPLSSPTIRLFPLPHQQHLQMLLYLLQDTST